MVVATEQLAHACTFQSVQIFVSKVTLGKIEAPTKVTEHANRILVPSLHKRWHVLTNNNVKINQSMLLVNDECNSIMMNQYKTRQDKHVVACYNYIICMCMHNNNSSTCNPIKCLCGLCTSGANRSSSHLSCCSLYACVCESSWYSCELTTMNLHPPTQNSK